MRMSFNEYLRVGKIFFLGSWQSYILEGVTSVRKYCHSQEL